MSTLDYGHTQSSYEMASSVSVSTRDRRTLWPVIVIGGALSMSATSSAEPICSWEAPYVRDHDSTGSGEAWKEIEPNADHQSEITRQAVSELRRLSGLTWEQLSRLFGVSRRSIHFWASGKPLNAANEKRLLQVLGVVRDADRGDARSNRAALLEVHDGTTSFDLLVAERFEEARATLGRGEGRPRPVVGPLSEEARAAREPLRPDELIDAEHDRVHRDLGLGRAARTVRSLRGGTT